jgi:hypothetical protein
VNRRDGLIQDVAGDRTEHFATGKGAWLLWLAIVVPPLAFGVDLQASYLLVPWICETGRSAVWLHLVTLVALTGTVGPGVWALGQRRFRPGGVLDEGLRHVLEAIPAGDDGPGPERIRFMADVGVLTAAFMTLLVIGLAFAKWGLHACD